MSVFEQFMETFLCGNVDHMDYPDHQAGWEVICMASKLWIVYKYDSEPHQFRFFFFLLAPVVDR
jgi:hypothetical protein